MEVRLCLIISFVKFQSKVYCLCGNQNINRSCCSNTYTYEYNNILWYRKKSATMATTVAIIVIHTYSYTTYTHTHTHTLTHFTSSFSCCCRFLFLTLPWVLKFKWNLWGFLCCCNFCLFFPLARIESLSMNASKSYECNLGIFFIFFLP